MLKEKIIGLISSYSAAVIFLSLLIFSLFFQRDFLIYRDFSIIWHGALLTAEGYTPWNDFIMPISPLSIYFVGLFLSLTEKSWLAFQVFQIIMNCILLAFVSIFLIKFEKNKILIILSLFTFTFFYLIFLTHPWYNNFGSFFLLISIILANYHSKVLIFFAGIFSAFTIFIKVDFGFLAALSACSIIFYRFKDNDRRLFIQNISIFFLGLLSFLIFVISLYQDQVLQKTIEMMSVVSVGRFERIYRILEIRNIFLISIALWCVFFASKYKKHFFSYGLVIFSSVITSMFGGLEHTHYYFMFTLPPILYFCFQEKGNNKFLFFLLPMIIYLTIPALRLNAHIGENYLTGSFESEYFNKRNIKSDVEIISLESCSKYLVNVYGPSDFCFLDKMLESRLKASENETSLILNISELNFLGAHYQVPPIKNHPLWYKFGQTINKDFIEMIYEEINNGDYKYILVQLVPENYSSGKSRNELINYIKQTKRYSLDEKIYESPMCMIIGRSIQECGIYSFQKIE